MRNFIIASVATLFSLAVLSGCEKEKNSFDYPLDDLYGTWDITYLEIDGTWYNLKSTLFSKYASTATFNSNGTYTGSGYFGNGTGTYKTKGNKITTYIDGEEYISYTITSLVVPNAEGIIGMTGSSTTMGFRAEKQ